jgi:RHS repeat-associated protein
VKRDNGTWGTPITTQVTDEVHGVEVEWRASSGAGQDDGLLRLWLDETQIGQILSVDNDTYVVDGVRMGVLTPPASTTSGTLCFDAFESRRSSYIGLLDGVQACGGGQRGDDMMQEEVVGDTLEITGTLMVEAMIVELSATLPVTWEVGMTETVEVTVTEVLSPTLPTDEAVDAGLALAALLESLPSAPQGLENQEDGSLTIVYEYDRLNRLTSATYSDGRYFEYTYDSVGNRLSEATDSGTVEYDYDVANRLVSVGSVSYTWDDNGNLLDDEVNTYTYNQANRLLTVSSTEYEIEYEYNGLGDRLSQTVDSETTTYTLDLASGLTQVLADETKTYLYGAGRVAQFTGANEEYFLTDALGSVRQIVDENGDLTLARGYEPYGEELEAGGEASSSYGFTGEWTDETGLLYLRARYYAPQDGRFLTRDTWRGDQQRPMSYNAWLYVYANPVNLTDPSGMCPDMNRDGKCDRSWECDLMPSPYREWCWGELGCGSSGVGGIWPEFKSIVGDFNLSAYYVVHETQYYSGPGSQSDPVPSLGNITANKYFLFSDVGVCMAGTGKLKDGTTYIGCVSHIDWNTQEVINNQYGSWTYTMPPEGRRYREEIPFFPKSQPAPPQFQAFETVAVCGYGPIPRDVNGHVEIRITTGADDKVNFVDFMQGFGHDNILKVTDVGGGLNPYTIDIFVGEQPPYPETKSNYFADNIVNPILSIEHAKVEYRVLR